MNTLTTAMMPNRTIQMPLYVPLFILTTMSSKDLKIGTTSASFLSSVAVGWPAAMVSTLTRVKLPLGKQRKQSSQDKLQSQSFLQNKFKWGHDHEPYARHMVKKLFQTNAEQCDLTIAWLDRSCVKVGGH